MFPTVPGPYVQLLVHTRLSPRRRGAARTPERRTGEVRSIDDLFSTVFRVVAGLIAGVAGLGGVLALVRGPRRGAADRELARTGARTSGVVLDTQMHSGSEGGMTYSPVVRFADSTGRDQVVAGEDRSSTSRVTGTTVQVLYDPERPDHVAVGTSRAGPVGAVVVGMVFLAFASAVVVGVAATVGWTGDAIAFQTRRPRTVALSR